ncbi:hypothetical protein VFPPC_18097 [Pochonia chlamydosporia 170]|uniref:Uncharacterized protein n=1 Tax=Pochonia chlamydosporia 170 TaxID=1380566 RepID=A0A219AQU9_METCM|nr:hypothetical protein VFPPC_18097 [Pochonia chlamydosporia 170]OWT42684.1 hypothetical protein VFPPC_18097 [Pochonia chlamydosporia 170]
MHSLPGRRGNGCQCPPPWPSQPVYQFSASLLVNYSRSHDLALSTSNEAVGSGPLIGRGATRQTYLDQLTHDDDDPGVSRSDSGSIPAGMVQCCTVPTSSNARQCPPPISGPGAALEHELLRAIFQTWSFGGRLSGDAQPQCQTALFTVHICSPLPSCRAPSPECPANPRQRSTAFACCPKLSHAEEEGIIDTSSNNGGRSRKSTALMLRRSPLMSAINKKVASWSQHGHQLKKISLRDLLSSVGFNLKSLLTPGAKCHSCF